MRSFREFVREGFMSPYRAHLIWKRALPEIEKQLIRNPHQPAMVNAGDLHPHFPKNLQIGVTMHDRHNLTGGGFMSAHTNYHEWEKPIHNPSHPHRIDVEIGMRSKGFMPHTIINQLRSPRTLATFAHEHEHYTEHMEDIAKHGIDHAYHNFRSVAMAGFAQSKGMEDIYYNHRSEVRARNVQLALMARKKALKPGDHDYYNHMLHADTKKTAGLRDYIRRNLD